MLKELNHLHNKRITFHVCVQRAGRTSGIISKDDSLQAAHDVFLFFLHPGSQSAQACIASAVNKHLRISQHFPLPVQTGSAVSACFCDGIGHDCLRMLVRGTVHGMQGPPNVRIPERYPKYGGILTGHEIACSRRDSSNRRGSGPMLLRNGRGMRPGWSSSMTLFLSRPYPSWLETSRAITH